MVKRIYVQKRPGFDVEAKGILSDLQENLQIKELENVIVLNRYDVSGIDEETYEKAKNTVFSEPQVDICFDDRYDFEKEELKSYFPEFREYEGTCRFLGCNHVSEPGCMVKNALEEGKIHRTRYNDYLEMYCELEQKEKRRY